MRSCGDKEAVFQCFGHFEGVIRDMSRCHKEGRDTFDQTTFMPGCCLPKVLRSGVMKEIVCPLVFRSGNGVVKRFDCSFPGLARQVVDSSEGGRTVSVPPMDTTRVRSFLFQEDLQRGKVDVRVELFRHKVK